MTRIEVSRLFATTRNELRSRSLGAHVFERHAVASLKLKNSSDLLTIKEILRHKSIESSMCYLHLTDATKRFKYSKFLRL